MALAYPTTKSRVRSRHHVWSRAEFRRAEDCGLFNPEKRVELIEGEVIVRDKYVKAPHAAAQSKVERVLRVILPDGIEIRGQLPLALGRKSDPIPDVCVVPASVDDYADEHPTRAELVVEISDSTLRFDQTRKFSLYALHGVPEYWIINLRERTLEVYREPAPSSSGEYGFRYKEVSVFQEGQTVSPLFMPSATISISVLLPPARKR